MVYIIMIFMNLPESAFMRVDHLHMVCRIAPAAKEYFDLRLNKEKKVCYRAGINELMKVN